MKKQKATSSSRESVVIQDFTVIQVRFNEKSKAGHYLYVKLHNVREVDLNKPRDRTLFVLNVPPYCNEECLQRLFSDCGPVEKVYIHKKPTAGVPAKNESEFFPSVQPVQGFKVAYIVFENPSGVQNAKNLPFDEPKIISTDDHPLITGMRKWCAEYRANKPQSQALQEEVEKYMEDYDRKIQEELEREKQAAEEPDEDGWVTVSKHGKNKGVPRTEAQDKKVKARERKKRKDKELLNFYQFQMKESKMEKIAQLRQKFEEDKNRIALMRAQRKFRPF